MKRHSVVVVCLSAVMVAASIFLYLWNWKKPDQTVVDAYADPKSCAQCHIAEAATYATTGMARTFYRPQAKDTVEIAVKDRQFFHAASGTYYSMTEHEGKYFQRRWQDLLAQIRAERRTTR